MKTDLTEIVTILDRSGSMASLTNDTIGGYNNFIEEQKKVPGEANVTTVLFDDEYTVLHDRVDIKKISPITSNEYFARGTTALFDAVGKTINTIGAKLSAINEENRPSKVIVLIITDGEENSSKEFNKEQIKQMVETQQNTFNWKFLFFGANIDSFTAAGSIGIHRNMTVDFSATDIGLKSTYNAMAVATTAYRNTGNIDDSYKKDVK
jgi:uncharacterized protein YegL